MLLKTRENNEGSLAVCQEQRAGAREMRQHSLWRIPQSSLFAFRKEKWIVETVLGWFLKENNGNFVRKLEEKKKKEWETKFLLIFHLQDNYQFHK